MTRIVRLDKGSKKRMRKIGWTLADKATLALLVLALSLFCIFVGLWDASNYPIDLSIPDVSLR